MMRTWLPQPAKIGIDLGTARTRFWVAGSGVVLDEPTILAIDTSTHKVMAVGRDAEDMIGRVRSPIKIIRPVQESAITDKEFTAIYLKILLQRVIKNGYFFRPVLMIAVNPVVVAADKSALVEVLYEVGGGEVYTINSLLASAIGAGVPIADASGTGLFLVGESSAAAGIISLSSVVTAHTTFKAGSYVKEHLRYQIQAITEVEMSTDSLAALLRTASFDPEQKWKLAVVGKDKVTGRPCQLEIHDQMVAPTLSHVFDTYQDCIHGALAAVSPALSADILDKGLLLAGGLSQMPGLDIRLTTQLGLPVATVEQPDLVVIEGVGTTLEHLDLFKESIGYRNSL